MRRKIGSAIAFQGTKGHLVFFSPSIIQKEATPQGAKIEILVGQERHFFFFSSEGKDNVRIWGRRGWFLPLNDVVCEAHCSRFP